MRHTTSEKDNTRVLVTDRTRLGTELLANALQQTYHFNVYVSEYDERDFRKHLEAVNPQLVLISADRRGMNGAAGQMLDVAHQHSRSLRTVIVLHTYSNEQVGDALRSGAWMVLTADQRVSELVRCMRSAQVAARAELEEVSL
jgi:DNA-binding NarL/FixJ family response regulator